MGVDPERLEELRRRAAVIKSERGRLVLKAVKYGMIGGGSTVAEKLKIAKEAGFDGVELDSPSDLDRDEVLAARDESEIEIPGVVDSVHWTQTLSDPDPAVRMAGRHALEQAILDCRAYGGSQVLLVPGVVNADVGYREAYERSQAELARVLPFAAEQGVRIALENVWNNFLLSPLEVRRYIEELSWLPGGGWMTASGVRLVEHRLKFVNEPVLGAYVDIGNLWHAGWPVHWLEAIGRRHVFRLDIKGYSRAKADKEGKWAGFGVEIGDGDVPWDSVREWIAKEGWRGWAVAEVRGGDLARLNDIAARMDRVLGLS